MLLEEWFVTVARGYPPQLMHNTTWNSTEWRTTGVCGCGCVSNCGVHVMNFYYHLKPQKFITMGTYTAHYSALLKQCHRNCSCMISITCLLDKATSNKNVPTIVINHSHRHSTLLGNSPPFLSLTLAMDATADDSMFRNLYVERWLCSSLLLHHEFCC